MTRVVWNNAAEKFYELGVDRGVLYVDNVGVPWNGLVSVDEAPSGGDPKSYYQDGVKYLNRPMGEEFEATLSAFYSPPEFDACDGSQQFAPGVFASQQRRKQFGLCYRTKIGNAVTGPNHAYKIHLVYNALAAPTSRSYGTITDTVEPNLLRWGITTKPVRVPGKRPTAHLIIDTTVATPGAVEALERLLYGTTDNMPRLPTPAEIIELFTHPFEFTVTANVDGTYTIAGPIDQVEMLTPTTYKITGDEVTLVTADSAQISSD